MSHYNREDEGFPKPPPTRHELERKISDLEKRLERVEEFLKRNDMALKAAWRMVPIGSKS